MWILYGILRARSVIAVFKSDYLFLILDVAISWNHLFLIHNNKNLFPTNASRFMTPLVCPRFFSVFQQILRKCGNIWKPTEYAHYVTTAACAGRTHGEH